MKSQHSHTRTGQQSGAALLLALLTVALVTTLASAAAWRQWRGVEAETAVRLAQQRQWWAQGAADWALATLREDARADLARGEMADHGGEAWARGLPSTPLAEFTGSETGDSATPVRLSGELHDAQARLNLTNLLQDNAQAAVDHAAFKRLFLLLGIDNQHLDTLTRRMPRPPVLEAAAATNAPAPAAETWPLQRLHHLVWAGLPQDVVDRLAPFVTVLPERTAVNANTATPEVLAATLGLELGAARALVAQRQRQPWLNADKLPIGLLPTSNNSEALVGIGSRYFELLSVIDGPSGAWRENLLLKRNGLDVRILRRERALVSAPQAVAPSLQ